MSDKRLERIKHEIQLHEDLGMVFPGKDEFFQDFKWLVGEAEKLEMTKEALEIADVALGDWTVSYASDQCNEIMVRQTAKRINEGGTLYYIANCRANVLLALSKIEGKG